jgi:hypothetical protein
MPPQKRSSALSCCAMMRGSSQQLWGAQQGCNVFKKSHVFLVMSFWSLKK